MTTIMMREHEDIATQSGKGRPARLRDPEVRAALESTYDGSGEVVQQLSRQFRVSESTIRAWAKHLELTRRSRPRTQSSESDHHPWQFSLAAHENALTAPHDSTKANLDIVRLYLHDVSKYPRLTAQEEVTLGQRIAQNDQQAKHALILANLPLVIRIAKNYALKSRGALHMLDLIQEGTLGLIHAVDIFDVRRGFRFSTLATWWIRQAVFRAIQTQKRAIRLSGPAQEQLSKIHRLQFQAEKDLTPEDLAEQLSVTPERIHELLDASQEIWSLDVATRDEEGTSELSEIVAAPSHLLDNALIHADLQQQLTSLLDTLRPRDRSVIVLRYGLEGHEALTLEQTGKLLGITRERVRQIEGRVLRGLRSGAEQMQLQDYLSA